MAEASLTLGDSLLYLRPQESLNYEVIPKYRNNYECS